MFAISSFRQHIVVCRLLAVIVEKSVFFYRFLVFWANLKRFII